MLHAALHKVLELKDYNLTVQILVLKWSQTRTVLYCCFPSYCMLPEHVKAHILLCSMSFLEPGLISVVFGGEW